VKLLTTSAAQKEKKKRKITEQNETKN